MWQRSNVYTFRLIGPMPTLTLHYAGVVRFRGSSLDLPGRSSISYVSGIMPRSDRKVAQTDMCTRLDGR